MLTREPMAMNHMSLLERVHSGGRIIIGANRDALRFPVLGRQAKVLCFPSQGVDLRCRSHIGVSRTRFDRAALVCLIGIVLRTRPKTRGTSTLPDLGQGFFCNKPAVGDKRGSTAYSGEPSMIRLSVGSCSVSRPRLGGLQGRCYALSGRSARGPSSLFDCATDVLRSGSRLGRRQPEPAGLMGEARVPR